MAVDKISFAPQGKLTGQVAIVTGVDRLRGMANSAARLLAAEGAQVVVTDIAPEMWDRVAEFETDGHTVFGLQADLTNLDDVKALAAKVVDQFDRIDILVNAAGKSVPPRPPFLKMDTEYWDAVMDRNLRTTVNCCWAVLPYMVDQRYGRVINFSSVTGVRCVYRYSAAYAASKGAVSALTRALALEMGEHKITVNAILPGDIDTGDVPWRPEDGRRDLGLLSDHLSSPLPRPGRSEEVANLVFYLACPESSYITGTEMVIDGGATIIEPFPGGPE